MLISLPFKYIYKSWKGGVLPQDNKKVVTKIHLSHFSSLINSYNKRQTFLLHSSEKKRISLEKSRIIKFINVYFNLWYFFKIRKKYQYEKGQDNEKKGRREWMMRSTITCIKKALIGFKFRSLNNRQKLDRINNEYPVLSLN